MKLKFLNPYNYYNYILKKFKKINRLKKQRKKISKKFLFKNLKKISSPEELLIFHFEKISEKEHINKEMFELLLTHLSKKSLHILETGSSGTHGSGSSTLFASYVTLFGGTFNTVDLNPKIKESFEFFESEKVKFHVEDSLSYIKK
jgi:hypothetical protein